MTPNVNVEDHPLIWIITKDEELVQFLSKAVSDKGLPVSVRHYNRFSEVDVESSVGPDILVVEVSTESRITLLQVSDVLGKFKSARGIVLCDQKNTASCRNLIVRGVIRDYFLIRPTLDRDYLQIQLWRALQDVAGANRDEEPDTDQTDILELPSVTSPPQDARFSGCVALVVEDEVVSRAMLCDMLTFEGFEAKGAGDVRKAVELYREERLDLILLDLFMPGISGPPAIKVIRKHFQDQNVPIVITSSYSDAETVTECIKEGIKDYIVKPIRQETLLPRLAKVLHMA